MPMPRDDARRIQMYKRDWGARAEKQKKKELAEICREKFALDAEDLLRALKGRPSRNRLRFWPVKEFTY